MRYLFVFLTFLACSQAETTYKSFGEPISKEDAIAVEDFLANVSEEESVFKVRAVIEEVCQMKGCWMTLRNKKNENIRVTFKDYGFFVPKDISGREVIIEGDAMREVLEEDLAKHYADDEGKEYDESMRSAITFVAKGVLVAESAKKS